jgi:ATP-dependent Lhr-like helicase
VISRQPSGGIEPPGLPTTEPQRNRRVIPTSVAPITFFVRDDADWMALIQSPARAAAHDNALSPIARQVLEYLLQRGASFFADIVRGTSILKSEVETGLWELVAAGLVTADGFDNLRSLIDPKRRAGQGHGRSARPRHSTGRWSLLCLSPEQQSPVAGRQSPEKGREDAELAIGDRRPASASRARAVESACWMLLRRYGVVLRELLARETVEAKWRELLMCFRRLEDRGEVRAGRFVSGFLGEQFALPVAVESLRAERKRPTAEAAGYAETITLSAADPLNLVGIVVPGERVASISGNLVSFREGIAVEPEHHWDEASSRTFAVNSTQRAAN